MKYSFRILLTPKALLICLFEVVTKVITASNNNLKFMFYMELIGALIIEISVEYCMILLFH